MKKALRLSAVLVMALLLGLPATTVAQGGPDASGFRALSGQKAAAFSVPGDMQLVKTFHLSRYSLTYERYQQVFGAGGAEVLGGQITLYRDNGGNITTVIGAHYPNIVPTSAVGLTQASARRVVDRDLGPGGQRKVDLLSNPTTGRYFYQVETRSFATRWFHWIDAANGQVLKKYDGITSDDATGVNGGTKSVNLLTTFHAISGHGASGAHWDLFSTDNRQKTYDYRNRDPNIYFVTDADNHWNLVKNNRRSPGQPALFDAQYYAKVTDDYLLGLGLDWIADCGYPAMESVSHYLRNYNNAHWTGAFLLYGDGDGTLFRQLSGGLDVVAHEATHGVTDCTSGLICLNESGALNESFSDIIGNSAEFYAQANGLDPTVSADWLVGEDIYLPADSAAGDRNMADPEEDGDPDHYSERQVGGGDNGGVHTNSGIPNHAYYLLVNGGLNASCASPGTRNSAHCTGAAAVAGIGLPDAEKIFFPAFMGLSSNATMANARAATETVASSLFGAASQQLDSTTDAWVAVGVGPTSPVTDIAVTSVSAPSSAVQGAVVDVDVTVTNLGNQNVATDILVTLADDTDTVTIGTQTIFGGLTAGASAMKTFSWDTTPASLGDHTLTATQDFGDANGGNDSNSTTVTVNEPGGVCTLLPAGASCTDNTQCCSNKCKGKSGSKTCKGE